MDYVLRLAKCKAEACVKTAHPGETIIAADTAVTVDGDILGKPRSPQEAVAMLRQLRGRRHLVCTGYTIKDVDLGTLVAGLCTTDVPMRSYTEAEIQAYTLTGDPLDKAGAYAIQHVGFHPVETLAGCYASVMGLPLCHLARSLRTMNISPVTDLPAACQSALKYTCPIFSQVLAGEDIG